MILVNFRLDKGVKNGSVIGIFLHFASKTLTVFNDGHQQGDPISIYNQNERMDNKIYYPVISLNKNIQVLINCINTVMYF